MAVLPRCHLAFKWEAVDLAANLSLPFLCASFHFQRNDKRNTFNKTFQEPVSVRMGNRRWRMIWKHFVKILAACSPLTLTGVMLLWSSKCFHALSILTSAHTMYLFPLKSRWVLNFDIWTVFKQPRRKNSQIMKETPSESILPCCIDRSCKFSVFRNGWC